MPPNLNLILPSATAILIACFGWYIVHRLNVRREVTAEARRLRVTYLFEVYRKLERSANRFNDTSLENWTDIESAIADIQLLGSPDQAFLARSFAAEFGNEQSASTDELLNDLRASLREELELIPIAEPLIFLRYVQHAKSRGRANN